MSHYRSDCIQLFALDMTSSLLALAVVQRVWKVCVGKVWMLQDPLGCDALLGLVLQLGLEQVLAVLLQVW